MSDFPLEGKFKWDQLLARVGSPQLSERMRQKLGGGGGDGGEGEFPPAFPPRLVSCQPPKGAGFDDRKVRSAESVQDNDGFPIGQLDFPPGLGRPHSGVLCPTTDDLPGFFSGEGGDSFGIYI